MGEFIIRIYTEDTNIDNVNVITNAEGKKIRQYILT